jgi:hypothetical protein
MDHVPPLAVALPIALTLTASVIATLWRPLHRLMLDACGSPTRARFWSVHIATMLVLTACVTSAWATTGGRPLAVMRIAEAAITWTLIALTAGVAALGWGVWSGQRAAPPPAAAVPPPATPAA